MQYTNDPVTKTHLSFHVLCHWTRDFSLLQWGSLREQSRTEHLPMSTSYFSAVSQDSLDFSRFPSRSASLTVDGNHPITRSARGCRPRRTRPPGSRYAWRTTGLDKPWRGLAVTLTPFFHDLSNLASSIFLLRLSVTVDGHTLHRPSTFVNFKLSRNYCTGSKEWEHGRHGFDHG